MLHRPLLMQKVFCVCEAPQVMLLPDGMRMCPGFVSLVLSVTSRPRYICLQREVPTSIIASHLCVSLFVCREFGTRRVLIDIYTNVIEHQTHRDDCLIQAVMLLVSSQADHGVFVQHFFVWYIVLSMLIILSLIENLTIRTNS